MNSINQTMTTALRLGLLLTTFVTVTFIDGGFASKSAVGQDRRSDDDDDRRDSGDRRRGFGFGRRDRDEKGDRDRDDRREKPSDQKPSDKSSDADATFTADTWAKSLVKKHDRNSNSMLDGDELQQAGRQASAADANKDNVVTIDELVAHAGGKSKPAAGAASSSTASSSDSEKKSSAADNPKPNDSKPDASDRGGILGLGRPERGGASDRSSDKQSKSATASTRVFTWNGGGKPGDDSKKTRRTYRFTPARERLPSELPGWFKSQDKNGDGQVAMSEYSRSWSKSTVAKFQGYDVDGDGVVTAKEVAGKK